MSEEECDYMSEDFLAQCTGGTDVKPGLQKTKAQQREHLKAMKRIANHEEMQRNKKIRCFISSPSTLHLAQEEHKADRGGH